MKIIPTFLIGFFILQLPIISFSQNINEDYNLHPPQESIKQERKPITTSFILGQFNYKTDPYFTKVSPALSNKTIYLQSEVYAAFLKMQQGAQQENIVLTIVSGTRNFEEQKAIWTRKWNNNTGMSPIENAKHILLYSSMPGSSRHHWGTDIDLINLTNTYFNTGTGLKAYNWLLKHANSFGFYQVYTAETNRTGYNEEKWHWSYLPLASTYLEYYNTHISATAISGFPGAELATELHIIPNYVNGIASKAKQFGQ